MLASTIKVQIYDLERAPHHPHYSSQTWRFIYARSQRAIPLPCHIVTVATGTLENAFSSVCCLYSLFIASSFQLACSLRDSDASSKWSHANTYLSPTTFNYICFFLYSTYRILSRAHTFNHKRIRTKVHVHAQTHKGFYRMSLLEFWILVILYNFSCQVKLSRIFCRVRLFHVSWTWWRPSGPTKLTHLLASMTRPPAHTRLCKSQN